MKADPYRRIFDQTLSASAGDICSMHHTIASHIVWIWLGRSEQPLTPQDGLRTIIERQVGCVELGIHCKAKSKCLSIDITAYYTKIMNSFRMAVFDQGHCIVRMQGVKAVGRVGKLGIRLCVLGFPRAIMRDKSVRLWHDCNRARSCERIYQMIIPNIMSALSPSLLWVLAMSAHKVIPALLPK